MAFVEDLSPFFQTAEFASNATLNGVAVRGIFDNAFQLADVGGNGLASTQPVFTLATSDAPSPVVGASLVVNGVTYTVQAAEPDGTGVSQLFLEVVA